MLGCDELRTLGRDQLQRLTREVLQGEADIVLNTQNKPERVVQVAFLETLRDGGCLFVQIGKTDDLGGESKIIPSCGLPGGKQAFGMRHREVFDLLLGTKLWPLKDCICNEEVEFSSSCVKAKTLQIMTRYDRTVCHAKLHRDIEAPMCRYSGQVISDPSKDTKHEVLGRWGRRPEGSVGIGIRIKEVDVHVINWNGKTSLSPCVVVQGAFRPIDAQQRRDTVPGQVALVFGT